MRHDNNILTFFFCLEIFSIEFMRKQRKKKNLDEITLDYRFGAYIISTIVVELYIFRKRFSRQKDYYPDRTKKKTIYE